MRQLSLTFLTAFAVVAFAAPVQAQNRLVVEGGGIMPVGDFGEVFNFSPVIGARLELQRANPMGQVALASAFLRGHYSPLSGEETPLGTPDGDLLHLGIGARVASMAAPFSASVGVGWTRVEIEGADDSGFAANVGLGYNIPLPAAHIELGVEYHIAFLEDDELSYLSYLAGIGLPF